MYQLVYEIETLSPVLLTQLSGDMNMVSTLDYIPGTVVQGIFANKYIKTSNLQLDAHEDPMFHKWFLNSGVIFTNAYIANEEDGKKVYFSPTPLSISKYKIANSEGKIIEAFDLLIEDPDSKQKDQVEKQKDQMEPYCRIESCKIFTNYVSKSINFHHARENRLKGHSEEGTIFNYESLDSGQIFAGRILGSENDLKQIKALIESQEKIRIGRSKNVQYGEAKLKWISNDPEKYESELQGFLPDKLNSKFILTFLSPAIIYNEYGFSSASISTLREYLAESLNFETLNLTVDDISIIKSFKRTEVVENFVGKWFLKKPSENLIKAGSCFEIKIQVTDDQFDKDIKESLLKLQKTGIGERTGEGFGRFAINLQKKEKYELNKSEDEEKEDGPREDVRKPDGEIPDMVKGIVKDVILNSYKTRIEAKALEDCSGFLKEKSRIPSNSLLGKLDLMLRDSESPEKFMMAFETFPQLTKNKLDRCRNKEMKETLYSFLVPRKDNSKDKKDVAVSKDLYKKKEYEIFPQFDEDYDLNEACILISFDPKEDEDTRSSLYFHYWITFLTKMRKESKKTPVVRERREN
ncbi:hypothetical protein [Methanosarcina mazei]|jgi:CRISPR-associated protein Csx10|uniref:DUF324 domain-containing protein n=1 Tax=Methanosarcina mazei LYC TaxID=1434114 RepID=A0A0E3RRI2_METMZ|nr:hypothetical protein [Methanosarcina mazei]AKB67857.1 DUF324 domain-containing protein [Methanosarcina mazei LYC]